jgi:hypothetical protein
MIQQPRGTRVHERWAHLRFSVIGQLLAAPPAKGELRAAIAALAARTWQHPTTGCRFRSIADSDSDAKRTAVPVIADSF